MSQLWDNDITTDRRPYVMELQNYLRALQRAEYGTTTVPMDGFFGEDTAAALRQFQETAGLSPTGTADRDTWEAVVSAYRESQKQQAPALTIRGWRQPILQPGDAGDEVVFLNTMLRTHGAEYTTDTEEAVRNIQRVSFLPVTGNTDKETWDAVTALYNQGVVL